MALEGFSCLAIPIDMNNSGELRSGSGEHAPSQLLLEPPVETGRRRGLQKAGTDAQPPFVCASGLDSIFRVETDQCQETRSVGSSQLSTVSRESASLPCSCQMARWSFATSRLAAAETRKSMILVGGLVSNLVT